MVAKPAKTKDACVINGDRDPDPLNPHTWLPLIGDPPGETGLRILYGVLRPEYRGWRNSAVAMTKAKLQPVPPPADAPWAVTAARAEVLLPDDADDRFACPKVLMEAHDAEQPADKPVVLSYVTITWPTSRLHRMYEIVRAVMLDTLVRDLGVAVLLVQHAPHRAASSNLPHVHALIGRRVTSLGLASFAAPLCGDKGRDLIVAAFEGERAEGRA
ncbi:hypothetical protein [uncultured Sphingomonas sp.]|uniref:hypothetical protein n=1 Tax=uncultured Sphingomonas sp. TaxID=158754 RepID=UPI0035CA75C3